MALITDGGHPEHDGAVERSAVTPVGPRWSPCPAVGACHRDLVAEEPRRAGAGVGDQCLVLREGEFELVAQEHRKTLFDLLGFGLGSGEPQQGVVGVAAVAQPAVAGIIGILAGQGVQLLDQ